MILRLITVVALACSALILGACGAKVAMDADPKWAIAIHAGAGVIPKTASPAEIAEHEAALNKALNMGIERLSRGDSALDVCEAVVRILEDDPHFNAGKGAAFNEQGKHELDAAAMMDGATQRAGAVAAVRTVKNPISLARLVMERTPHILLIADGAEAFADTVKVERVPNEYFSTPKRREMLDEVLRERANKKADATPPADPRNRFATVGCVVMQRGTLAAATSTGGLTGKRFGRVGDSPIIGAGTYANATCAVSCTGTGEQFMRHTVARDVAARMELAGESVDAAARHMIFKVLQPDDGGLIAVSRQGDISMPFSSEGMFRAAADWRGLRVVKIWE